MSNVLAVATIIVWLKSTGTLTASAIRVRLSYQYQIEENLIAYCNGREMYGSAQGRALREGQQRGHRESCYVQPVVKNDWSYG